MITERELRHLAARNSMGAGQAEREYAQLVVLDTLGKTPLLSDGLCFKGGTALRLIYFDDWRHSVDLDFSALPGLPPGELRPLAESWFAGVSAVHDMEMSVLDFHRAGGAVRMRASFTGPLRFRSRLLFDITLDELIVRPPERRPVIASLFPSLRPIVLAYCIEEILAEKLRSILQRGKSRDYYDVWRVLADKPTAFDPAVVRSVLIDKCKHRDMEPPAIQDFVRPQRLAEAESFWKRDLAGHTSTPSLPDWAQVTRDLPDLLENLLSD